MSGATLLQVAAGGVKKEASLSGKQAGPISLWTSSVSSCSSDHLDRLTILDLLLLGKSSMLRVGVGREDVDLGRGELAGRDAGLEEGVHLTVW